jgi:hypothetical protein
MSAFLVSKDCITRIVDVLSNLEKEELEEIFGTAHKDTVGYQLWKMNQQAVNQRYNEKDEAPAYIHLHSISCSPMQSYKSLRCYLYQCSEGDVPESQLYKKLQVISDSIGASAASSTAEYCEADWG